MNQVMNSYTCNTDELYILARYWLREIWMIRYLYRVNGSCEYHDLDYAKSRLAMLEVSLGTAISAIDEEVAEEFAIVRDYYLLKSELTDVADDRRSFPRLGDFVPPNNRVFEIDEARFATLQQHSAAYNTDSTSFVSVETGCSATKPYCCFCWSTGNCFCLRRLPPTHAAKLHRLASLRLVSCAGQTECPVCARTMNENSMVVHYSSALYCSHGCAEVAHRGFNDSSSETQPSVQ